MATPISDLYDGIRVLIGDLHADSYLYEDDALRSAVRLIIQSGSPFEAYALDGPKTGIEPVVSDPNAYGLMLLRAARSLLTPHADGLSVRHPGMSIVDRGKKATLWVLSSDAYEKEMAMEDGAAFNTYQDLYAYFAAHNSHPYFWSKMNVDEEVPVNTMTFSGSGVSLG
jgi:hypothetical protein